MGCCVFYHNHLKPYTRAFFSSIEIGICIAIICIIYYQLTDFDWDLSNWTSLDVDVVYVKCGLGTDDQGRDLCIYGYITCGVSILVSLTLGILVLNCWAKYVCHMLLAPWLEFTLSVIACAWWITCSLVLSRYNKDARDDEVPQKSWRDAVNILSWIMALLFTIQAVFSIFFFCWGVCGYCGGKEERTRRLEGFAKQKEDAKAAKAAKKAAEAAKKVEEGKPPAAGAAAGSHAEVVAPQQVEVTTK